MWTLSYPQLTSPKGASSLTHAFRSLACCRHGDADACDAGALRTVAPVPDTGHSAHQGRQTGLVRSPSEDTRGQARPQWPVAHAAGAIRHLATAEAGRLRAVPSG